MDTVTQKQPNGKYTMTTKQDKTILVHITTIPVSLYLFFIGQARYMSEQGFEVHGVSSPGEFLDQFAEREGAIGHAIEMPRAISPLKDIISVWKIYTLFRRIKPTIVHAHTPKGGLLGMIAAFLARVPVRIYHVHGFPYLTATGMQRFLLTLTEKISSILAHRVLFVSASVRQVALSDGICSDKKSKIIHHGSINGVDAVGRFNPELCTSEKIRRANGIAPDAMVIGFVGRIVRDKGVIELMTAWESLRRRFDNLILLVVGPFEERDAVTPELKERLCTDPRVCFIGEVMDTVEYYAAMDILVFPSYREGFSLVTMEASAMTLPVVATRIPGNVDSVIEGETGLFVPARDAAALEQALLLYLENKDLRRTHGCNGRKNVLSKFRPQDIWKAMYREYLDLMRVRGMRR